MKILSIRMMIAFAGLLAILSINPAFGRGILGPQPGDRSPEDNERWLQTGIDQIKLAIREANDGNAESTVEHGKNGMAAMKEISSEGWDGKRQRSVRAMRHGISAARKGELEKASLKFQEALSMLDGLKYGDMNFTHESFLGIGDGK